MTTYRAEYEKWLDCPSLSESEWKELHDIRHDAGRFPGKNVAVVSAVEADHNALFLCVPALGGDHVGKGLRRVADHVDVHVMQPLLHGAAKTCGAELQRCKEALANLFFILADGIEFAPLLFTERGAVQPTLILFHISTHVSLLNSLFLICFLFVIFCPFPNLEAPVQLLQQHHAGEVMGKGHF